MEAGARPSPPAHGAPVGLPLAGSAALALLLALPLGHLVSLPVAGAWANVTDAAVALFVGVGVVEWVARRPPDAPPGPPRWRRGWDRGMLLLALLGGWAAASGLWGHHPAYALAKGGAWIGLASAAVLLARTRVGWRRASGAWLAGAGLTVVAIALMAIWNPAFAPDAMLYGDGGPLGLPFHRVRGPFPHPNMFGDYLMVTGFVLWARWPELSGSARPWAVLLAAALVGLLVLTASSAWTGVGAGLIWLGLGPARGSLGRVGLVVLGTVVLGATTLALVLPLRLRIAGAELVTNGIRPEIWASSLAAVREAPLIGVGASPLLARAVDPVDGPPAVLWDAHNAYLSVLGQFGLVGALLAGIGVVLVLRAGLRRIEDRRVRRGLGAALVAVAVHAVFLASEDLRHAWLLLGLLGTVEAARRLPHPGPAARPALRGSAGHG